MAMRLYDTLLWDEARERTLARDGQRCTVARLLGGECHPRIDVHHLVPLSEGGAEYDDANLISVCHRHHPVLEAFRRQLLAPEWRCPHKHTSAEARRQCELRRSRSIAA